jgi:hypothetical protein
MLAAALLMSAGCRGTKPKPAPLPALPSAPLSDAPMTTSMVAPTTSPVSTTVQDSVARVQEKTITLTGDWDARAALEEIARTGGFSLVISAQLPPKKIRLSIVNAPASDALKAVLDASGLTLQSSSVPRLAWDPTIVFFQLPVNVNTLSVEAIMKRFGVSRTVAEMIVNSQVP